MTALVAEHQDAVYRYAHSWTHDDGDAEDVLQQTFLAALRHFDEFRGDGSVRGWLLRIARNEAIHLHRAEDRSRVTEEAELEALAQRAGWGQDNPESLVSLAEQEAVLQHALTRLKPSSREILILRDIEQLSGDETAQVLGIGLVAMKSRLHRARLELASALRTEGGDDNA